jgi:mRNA interferase RelE/StbE
LASPIWSIEFLKEAEKDLRKLDRPIQLRIVKFLRERVALLENPRALGAALSGSTLGDFWKYRVGDYRIIVDIQDRKLTVLVIAVGNRREIYR